MKFVVFVSLVGVSHCSPTSVNPSFYEMPVSTQEQCVEEAKKLATYPFVKDATCKVIVNGEARVK